MAISLFQKSLRDMIAGLRANRHNEDKYIQTTQADIKKELTSTDMKVKTVALQKLAYLNMLGYDMSWAAFHVIEVMSTHKLAHKVIGYHAASQSFNENTDVMLLITNLLKKDLTSNSQFERCIALDCLSNVVTLDLARDLVADVYGQLSSGCSTTRKRAALVLYSCFLKYPDALRPCFKGLTEHLDDHDQDVICSVVCVLCELVLQHPHNYLEMAPLFYKLLLTSNNNWMTMKLLKIFGALTPLEPRLTKKLAEPLKNIMSSTLAKSLLYECISTVCSGMTSNKELVNLAVVHLKDFVLDSDPNLKYLGFRALEEFVKHIPQDVMQFRDAAIQCLSIIDPTIRSSALRVINGLVTKEDLKGAITQILDHIPSSDTSYRNELSETILSICCRDKYSLISDFSWYLNILVELARVPNTIHGKTIAFQITDIACRIEAMRDDAVQAVRSLLMDPSLLEISGKTSVEKVLEATVWITGEYAGSVEHPKETIEALLQPGVLKLSYETQAMYIQTILKVFVHVATDLICNKTADEEQGEEEANESEGGEIDIEKFKVVEELSKLILDHVDQFFKNPNSEVVERTCQLKKILELLSKLEESQEARDFLFQIASIIQEDLPPVSGRSQKKIPVPVELEVEDNVLAEFSDDEFEAGNESDSQSSQPTRAKSDTYTSDAASMLTEATQEQKKRSQEDARDQLKQHRERHDIFYLGNQYQKESTPELSEPQETSPYTDSNIQESSPGMTGASSVDSIYSKMKRNRKKTASEIVIKGDEDVADGTSLESSPVKGNVTADELDVNVFAPLKEGEALPTLEAYPGTLEMHDQSMGIAGSGRFGYLDQSEDATKTKHKQRKSKSGSKGSDAKEKKHRRKHRHKSKKETEEV